MKNSNRYFPIFIALFLTQLYTSNLFGQTTIETETRSKCERCAAYLSNSNMTEYASDNCRAYASVCTALTQSAVIIGDNSPIGQLDFETGIVQPLVIFTDGFSKTSYEVTPKITILDKSNNIIATIKTDIFQQMTINDAGQISVKGIRKISRLGSEQSILTANVEFPEIEVKDIYIRVDFEYYNRQTQQTEVAESITRQFTL